MCRQCGERWLKPMPTAKTPHLLLLLQTFVIISACLEWREAYGLDDNGMSIDQAILQAFRSSNASQQMNDPSVLRVQLDMLFPADDWYAMISTPDNDVDRNKRMRRTAIRSESLRWPNAEVPYTLPDSFDLRELEELREAITDYHKYTCLRFREAMPTDADYVRIVDGLGCDSWVGRQGGVQELTLSRHCRKKGPILHEVSHVIGFIHEHSRPDRDQYISINSENIRIPYRDLYVKLNNFDVDVSGLPYDYESIMHFGQYMGSRNGQIVIETKNSSYQNIIGQRYGLSFRDVKLANVMYRCSERSRCRMRTCPGEGFIGGDCRCWCPSGRKDTAAVHCPDEVCGGTLVGTGNIRSPHFPGRYPNNSNCKWLLRPSPIDGVIFLEVRHFSTNSCCDFVRIFNSSGQQLLLSGEMQPQNLSLGSSANISFTANGSATGAGFEIAFSTIPRLAEIRHFSTNSCCDFVRILNSSGQQLLLSGDFQPQNLSLGSSANISFTANGSAIGAGFEIAFSTIPRLADEECGGTLVGTGNIQSPHFPDRYPNNSNCKWFLRPSPIDGVIFLEIRHFSTNSCCDFVRIFNSSGQQLLLSGEIQPQNLSLGSSANISFTANGSATSAGFEIAFSTIPRLADSFVIATASINVPPFSLRCGSHYLCTDRFKNLVSVQTVFVDTLVSIGRALHCPQSERSNIGFQAEAFLNDCARGGNRTDSVTLKSNCTAQARGQVNIEYCCVSAAIKATTPVNDVTGDGAGSTSTPQQEDSSSQTTVAVIATSVVLSLTMCCIAGIVLVCWRRRVRVAEPQPMTSLTGSGAQMAATQLQPSSRQLDCACTSLDHQQQQQQQQQHGVQRTEYQHLDVGDTFRVADHNTPKSKEPAELPLPDVSVQIAAANQQPAALQLDCAYTSLEKQEQHVLRQHEYQCLDLNNTYLLPSDPYYNESNEGYHCYETVLDV